MEDVLRSPVTLAAAGVASLDTAGFAVVDAVEAADLVGLASVE